MQYLPTQRKDLFEKRRTNRFSVYSSAASSRHVGRGIQAMQSCLGSMNECYIVLMLLVVGRFTGFDRFRCDVTVTLNG